MEVFLIYLPELKKINCNSKITIKLKNLRGLLTFLTEFCLFFIIYFIYYFYLDL